MTHIKCSDLEYQPSVVDQVMSSNPQPDRTEVFGNPYPGDPSIMQTIQTNQLGKLERQFARQTGLNRGTENYNTGNFNTISQNVPSRSQHSSNLDKKEINEDSVESEWKHYEKGFARNTDQVSMDSGEDE